MNTFSHLKTLLYCCYDYYYYFNNNNQNNNNDNTIIIISPRDSEFLNGPSVNVKCEKGNVFFPAAYDSIKVTGYKK